jgi:tRNA (Thr-GGU) A37 N-methylase
MKSILDPSFEYTSSENTDIAKTFARIRRMERQSVGVLGTRVTERPENVSVFHRLPRRISKPRDQGPTEEIRT